MRHSFKCYKNIKTYVIKHSLQNNTRKCGFVSPPLIDEEAMFMDLTANLKNIKG